jgi:hypothetical protein
VLDRAFHNPMDAEEQATLPFVGGIRQYGYQCGQIWGATLAGGARIHQQIGAGPESEVRTLLAAEKLVKTFHDDNDEVNCNDITSLHKESTGFDMVKYFLLKGGSIGCFRMASRYAPMAYDDIEAVLSQESVDVPDNPVSCTALLAQKLGAAEKHQTMAAGLAGGIGLSGEACGALGTAVWIMAMKMKAQNPDLDLWKDEDFGAKFETMVESFLAASGYEFECAAIVGRKFKDVGQHADHLRKGGCSEIIDALTAFVGRSEVKEN